MNVKRGKEYNQAKAAEEGSEAFRAHWEAVRDDAKKSGKPDLELVASLMLQQTSEKDQWREDVESQIWWREMELRDLVAELHPGEDGGNMLLRLEEFAKDPETARNVARLAGELAQLTVTGMAQASGRLVGNAAWQEAAENEKKTARNIDEFWPLRCIRGGDGQVKRLEWVDRPVNATQSAGPAVGATADGEPKAQASSPAIATPLQRTAAQDVAILVAIQGAGLDPLALPVNAPGKPGVKADIRAALVGVNPLFQRKSRTFDKAWERLRQRGEIANKA